jgi:nitrate/nitrite transport system substrate-binding protein
MKEESYDPKIGKPIARFDDYLADLSKMDLLPRMTRRDFVAGAAKLGVSASLVGLAGCLNGKEGSEASLEKKGGIEKEKLTVGFIPITCATPIIMAHPMGFYEKHGLDVTVKKYAGWADIRDAAIAGEIDAVHFLSPMPLSLSLGVGATKMPFRLPAIENVNGQAITIRKDHKVEGPRDMKGFLLTVPFDFSMHNLLLRHYLALGGLDPDKDVQIRVMRPPDMVANLAAGNIDGYLGPDPFNQRAVYEDAGYIHILSRDIWPGHPCCAFAAKQSFKEKYPNTYRALLEAIVEATHFSSQPENQKEIAQAIAPKRYLNQPVEVVEAVLTGEFEDGLGNLRKVPDRIDFDPYPWKSFSIWILTQLERWGYLKEGVDYRKVGDEVFLTDDCKAAQRKLGYPIDEREYKIEPIVGGPFDPDRPEGWVEKNIAV